LRSLTQEPSFMREKSQVGGNMKLKQSPLGLENVVINPELLNRPSKVPDYEAEIAFGCLYLFLKGAGTENEKGE